MAIHFEKTEFTGVVANVKEAPNDGLPEVVFAGRSNVGKSSLINSLLNRKNIARVSQTPGKTQLVVYFKVDNTFYLTDLPGYGFTKVSRSHSRSFFALADNYFQADRPIRLVLHLLDIRHEPSKQDLQMHEWLEDKEIPYVIVLNKADKLSRAQIFKQQAIIKKHLGLKADCPIFIISNSKKTGVSELKQYLIDLFS